MALVPGLHLSTSKSRCPPKPDEDANTCSSKHCDSKIYDDSVDSCSTSADGESLASFSDTDDSRSEMLEASQDVASDLCESDGEPSSPFNSMLLMAKRRNAMVQASRGRAPELEVVEAFEPSSPFSRMLQAKRQNAAPQATEPSSPFSSMTRAKRQSAFTCGL